MKHERILAIHDISCVGRCSLTVALPIISSVGIECSGLPTAVLSTHTGGFSGYTYRDLTEDMIPVDEHWMSLGISFDAFYTGFLGSFEQIDIVCRLFDDLRHEGTRVYVDPVMADSGRLYPVFGPDFPSGMRRLCERADVIMPNLTELCLMLGEPWVEGPYSREYIDSMLERAHSMGPTGVVLTGISFEEGMVGAVYRDFVTGESGEVMRPEIPGYYHGTGDVFGSALVGACECGLPLSRAVSAAVNLTVGSIIRTYESGEDVRYGVNFESGLRGYISEVDDGRPVRIEVAGDGDLPTIESLASEVWNEAYEGIVPQDQIDYMLARFQTVPALREQIANGYTYLLVTVRGVPAGYCGYVPDDGGLFLSKIYVKKEFRGTGLSGMLIDRLRVTARTLGLDRIHLTVNRDNARAIAVYEHQGFVGTGTADTPIGEGFVMSDYLMELKVRGHVHPHHPGGDGRPRMGPGGRHPRLRGHLHRQLVQRHGPRRPLADGPRPEGRDRGAARRLLRGGHLPPREPGAVLVGVRRMRRLHGGQLHPHQEVPEGGRLHPRRGQRPEAGPGVHRVHEPDQEALQGRADHPGGHRGQPQAVRPLRLLVRLGPQVGAPGLQGRRDRVRDGGAHQPRDSVQDVGGQGLEGRARRVLGILGQTGWVRGAAIVRRGVQEGRPPGVHEGVLPGPPQLRPRHRPAALPGPRREVGGAEPPPEVHDHRGAGLRLRLVLRERRPSLLRGDGARPRHGHRPQLDHHPPRLLR